VTVSVTVGKSTVARFAASAQRSDVARAHGVGAAHGYAKTIAVPTGKRTVCVTATGLGAGGDTALGCRTVTVR
jgi:endoglucanase